MHSSEVQYRDRSLSAMPIQEQPKQTIQKSERPEQALQSIDMDNVKIHLDEANQFLESNHRNLRFKIHEDLSRVYVQVVDRFSDEVIREVPPEKLLDLSAAILRQAGMIVDEKG